MITVYDLKARFQKLLRPISNRLAERGMTANQITIAALFFSVFFGILLCFNISVFWLFLPVFLFVRMGLNAIDGMLAREHNMKTNLGMALNEAGDVISDTALFIPFVLFAGSGAWVVALFIFLAFMTEFCGLLSFMMIGERRYDGPMGKSDRAFATGILGFFIGLGYIGPVLTGWVFLLLSIFCVWSCFNRLRPALKV